ncbi:CHAP domain-containing protein [Amycolatopsis alkalitolerans]|uniref:CHAP domain-containing protein n=1 Tax=Amycolatopsis alkalitolerans TaxID=2547244 RepID=A0A5C4LZ72_9PSEU|nr:CHAP domain-containing protein [Amycolatopsis alkalitolerans]TNC23606.1 CHAP domain-containing protein [Amycolatopsis alkalitolerans]
MDIAQIATLFAGEMKTHQGKLEGKAGEAQAAQTALESAAKAIMEQHDAQRKAAQSLLNHWDSKAATGFEGESAKLGDDLTTTAEASVRGAKIVSEVTQALSARHGTTGVLIDEFVTKAEGFLKAGYAMAGLAVPGVLLKALGEVTDLAGQYLKESTGQLKGARDEMEDAARKLRALEKELNHDGVADPGQAHHKPVPGKEHGHPKHHKGTTKPSHHSKKVDEILAHARKNLGYHEGPNNRNKWGPTGQPWCSYFATSMWREAGVNIPKYGFTGDVYKWGERHHLAYDRGAIAKQARPGDTILFGTGPSWSGSEHIGIIEKVDGNKITTIEGNSSDQVMRHTYTLPRDAHRFYGGVHPK